jgi:hypothetical protein
MRIGEKGGLAVVAVTALMMGCGGSAHELGRGDTDLSSVPGSGGGPGGPGTTPPSPSATSPSSPVTPTSADCGLTVPTCVAPPSFVPAVVAGVKGAGAGFRGTVTALAATTEPSLSSSDLPRAAVVHIDSVFAGMGGSAFLQSFVGKTITILYPSAPTVAVGHVGLYFANTAIVGTSIVMNEIADLDPAIDPAIDTSVPAIAKTIADRALYERLASASAIAHASVQAAPYKVGTETGSEHDPQWKEAPVLVACSLKGTATGATLKVRFAASTDVAWYTAPKLAPPEDGVFVLAADAQTGAPGSGYLVTDARDVQPVASLATLNTLLACPPPVL